MNVTVKPMPDIAAGNPYCSDAFHMRTTIGKNLELMYANFPGEVCKYLILVDITTGKRTRIEINQTTTPHGEKG